MQHTSINDGQWEEHGCFVYRVLKPVAVRTIPNVGDEHRTGLSFKTGDVVSVDFIRPSPWPGNENGPFLRLSDCSGWLFESKGSLERLVVTDGLWAFYVDNHPAGIHLRRHPFDNSPKVEPRVTYEPMQLIYCDKRVTTTPNGGNSYRVQGTHGWVFDKRNTRFMLLPESSVRSGLFAFQVLQAVSIRSKPDNGDGSRTLRSVSPRELVCGDLIREFPCGHGNGPFVRLTDGSGWVFVNVKTDPEPVLKEISVETGGWTFKILNSAGISLRRQPIDRCGKGDMSYETIHTANTEVKCDRRIASSTGVDFYRVQGTQGWLFDKRRGKAVMELLEHNNALSTVLSSSTDGWSVDFVRRAAMASGAEEIVHNSQSRVISFRAQDNVRINVYYTTRTIGTAMDHPSQGKTQMFRKNCTSQELADILLNPRIHTGRGYKTRSRNGDMKVMQAQHGPGVVVEEEEELRNTLLELDEKIGKLFTLRMTCLTSLKPYDDKRADAAAEMKKRIDKRNEEIVEMQQEVERRQQEKQERQREAAESERKRQHELTCGECPRVFSSDHARDQHCRDAHSLICRHCSRIFKSLHSLNQHRDATGHT